MNRGKKWFREEKLCKKVHRRAAKYAEEAQREGKVMSL
jgi:hypothetical protein